MRLFGLCVVGGNHVVHLLHFSVGTKAKRSVKHTQHRYQSTRTKTLKESAERNDKIQVIPFLCQDSFLFFIVPQSPLSGRRVRRSLLLFIEIHYFVPSTTSNYVQRIHS